MTLMRGMRIDVHWHNDEVSQEVVDLLHETQRDLMRKLMDMGATPAIHGEHLSNKGTEADLAPPLPVPTTMKLQVAMHNNARALPDLELEKELPLAEGFDDPSREAVIWLDALQQEKRHRELRQQASA